MSVNRILSLGGVIPAELADALGLLLMPAVGRGVWPWHRPGDVCPAVASALHGRAALETAPVEPVLVAHGGGPVTEAWVRRVAGRCGVPTLEIVGLTEPDVDLEAALERVTRALEGVAGRSLEPIYLRASLNAFQERRRAARTLWSRRGLTLAAALRLIRRTDLWCRSHRAAIANATPAGKAMPKMAPAAVGASRARRILLKAPTCVPVPLDLIDALAGHHLELVDTDLPELERALEPRRYVSAKAALAEQWRLQLQPSGWSAEEVMLEAVRTSAAAVVFAVPEACLASARFCAEVGPRLARVGVATVALPFDPAGESKEHIGRTLSVASRSLVESVA